MYKRTSPGVHSHQHKDGRIEWRASVYRAGKRWVAKGFSTRGEAMMGRYRLITVLDSNQLPWVTPRLLSTHEAATLLSQAPLWLAGPILMSLFAGLRVSEIVALQWNDMDFSREQLRVAGFRGGQAREFPLPKPLATFFRCWQKGFAPSSAMFVNGLGQPLTQAVMRRAFHQTCKRAGIPDLRLQDLRHTFAAWACQSQLPFGVVAVMMGARRSSAARYANYLHSLERWIAGPSGLPVSHKFHELSGLLVAQPMAYEPFLVSLFASLSPGTASAA